MRFFTETELLSGTTVYVCDFCGAYVTDTDRHTRWHRDHGDLPPKEPSQPRQRPEQPSCSDCEFSHPRAAVVEYHRLAWHGVYAPQKEAT